MTTYDNIEQLFKRNYPQLHRLATMLLHDPEGAHDVVHDVFSSLLESDRNEDVETAYLITCVRNRCLNRLRAIDVRERFKELYLIENPIEETEIEIQSEEPALEEIRECMDMLPPQCAKVFSLRFYEGMKSEKISEHLGIGERAVYKHLRRAIDTIRTKLNKNE